MITIIGARAFHCPVRNGKEWDHPAMVVRQNREFSQISYDWYQLSNTYDKEINSVIRSSLTGN